MKSSKLDELGQRGRMCGRERRRIVKGQVGEVGLYGPIRQTHNINLSMQQIQNKAETGSFWKGYSFFHGELYSVNDFDDYKYPFHEIKERENPTTDGPEDLPKLRLKTFSKKKLAPKYEISFEKEFMKEHRAAFQKHYQNYIESIKQKESPSTIWPLPESLFESQTQQQCQSALELLKTHPNILTSSQQIQFTKDLQHEQKLREFLDFIVQQCPVHMAAGFISVAHQLWMAYVPLQNQDMKVSKVVEFAKKVADGEVRYSLAKHFNHHPSQQDEPLEEFFKLNEVFCTTALLTITGYFENPFFAEQGQLQSFKRPWNFDLSSDQEDSFDSWQSIPTYKKRKSSA